MSTVETGKVVAFHYTLTNGAGEVLDKSGDTPLEYLHGSHNIVPGLERQLLGKSVGDKVDAVVPPEEGYGLKQGPGPQAVERSAFPSHLPLQPGMPFSAQAPDGQSFTMFVTSIEADQVYVDSNHPLAGETLNFAVEIASIRDATPEENAHGHPHGPEGHGHHH